VNIDLSITCVPFNHDYQQVQDFPLLDCEVRGRTTKF